MKKIFIIFAIIVAICISGCKSTEKSGSKELQNLPLTQTHWTLTAINGVPVGETPAEATIAFDDQGGISGCLGCNTFFGTYYAKKEKLDIEFKGATKRLCSDMSTEQKYISALQDEVCCFTIEGSTLIIKNKSQELLRFQGTAQNQ